MRRAALFAACLALAACMEPAGITVDPAELRNRATFSLNLLKQQSNVPRRAGIVYKFAPATRVSSEQSVAFIKAAQAAGYVPRQPRENQTVFVYSPAFTLTGDAIADRWIALSRLAAPYGFEEDGWAF